MAETKHVYVRFKYTQTPLQTTYKYFLNQEKLTNLPPIRKRWGEGGSVIQKQMGFFFLT